MHSSEKLLNDSMTPLKPPIKIESLAVPVRATPGDEYALITEGTENGPTPLPDPAVNVNNVGKPDAMVDISGDLEDVNR